MLLGRLFVGTGMGIGPAVAALYVSEVWELIVMFTCLDSQSPILGSTAGVIIFCCSYFFHGN